MVSTKKLEQTPRDQFNIMEDSVSPGRFSPPKNSILSGVPATGIQNSLQSLVSLRNVAEDNIRPTHAREEMSPIRDFFDNISVNLGSWLKTDKQVNNSSVLNSAAPAN